LLAKLVHLCIAGISMNYHLSIILKDLHNVYNRIQKFSFAASAFSAQESF
jgi:hypothetical protein